MKGPTPSRRIDARDIRILEIIQRQGRISKKALAHAVGLSLTPCFERLQRLEREGFIREYQGILDAQRFGSFIWICTEISLARHRATDFSRFEAVVLQMPEVLVCDAVGGGIDYILKIVARDVAHYQQLIDDLLAREVGVDTYFTYIVTKRVKAHSALPLAQLLPAPGNTDAPPR